MPRWPHLNSEEASNGSPPSSLCRKRSAACGHLDFGPEKRISDFWSPEPRQDTFLFVLSHRVSSDLRQREPHETHTRIRPGTAA